MNEVLQGILRWGKVIIGFVLMIAAFLLGFVPGIPGFPLALVGLALLATEFIWAKRLNEWIRTKYKQHVAARSRSQVKPNEPR